ncbi:arsenite methyltransferase [Desulfovibrio sp. TomC]|uniref:arsenite methyltransferase n=1 Tax=Desulfovibrio sp. TomC TaxID=1562888 RepID=UPI0005BE9A73|nr:arsenite methyltransferase [Desulfovibrio sp. TomC]
MKEHCDVEIRESIRTKYAETALSGKSGCGCGSGCGGPNSATSSEDLARMAGYATAEVQSVPEGANMGLGCGNPQAIAALRPGEVVVDLGSGGGFDCFLAARQVGETGRVIGVDMTPEMVEKARRNAVTAQCGNVSFRLGEIEYLPVPDGIADVVLSNCVVNLSTDKAQVFREAYRVLKPGGRLAISDIVATEELPETVRRDIKLHAACVAGAERIVVLEAMMREAGFRQVSIRPRPETKALLAAWLPGLNLENSLASASIEAVKA